MKRIIVGALFALALVATAVAQDRMECFTLRDKYHTRVCSFSESGRVNVERSEGDHYISIWYTAQQWLASPEYRQWEQELNELDARVRENELRLDKRCKANPPKDDDGIRKCKAVADMIAGRAGKRVRQTNVKSEGEAQSWHTQEGCENDGFVWRDAGCHAQR